MDKHALIWAGIRLGVEKPRFNECIDSLYNTNLEEVPFKGENYTLHEYSIKNDSTIWIDLRIRSD